MKHLVWFRSDLRVYDNPALFHACEAQQQQGVLAVFYLTPKTWREHGRSSCQVSFLLKQLAALSSQLKALNIPLLIRQVDTYAQVAGDLKKLVEQYKVSQLFYNQQVEWDERVRDQKVEQTLEQSCQVHAFRDQLLTCPDKIRNQQGEPFKVYTPYSKKVLASLDQAPDYIPLPKPKKQSSLLMEPDPIPDPLEGFACEQDISWLKAGEQAAQRQLEQFCREKLDRYEQDRDIPALRGTSRISPYLAIGALSVRQCVWAILQALSIEHIGQIHSRGAMTWLKELIWRDFYRYIMWHFPQVGRNQPFKPETKALPWVSSQRQFEAWCQGQTGFPIVDAAMRQLNEKGWMHNRLRMVVAVFLTKIMFMDWRWGERYFAQNLVDWDFASNNGGWQWCASTGTDAAPYFRIFNPTLQSEKFDAEGRFIRRYCPELKVLDNKAIHDPQRAKGKQKLQYPEPIVDYKAMRAHVLSAYKSLK